MSKISSIHQIHHLLKRLSGATQSTPLSLEKLPEVEEVPVGKLAQLSTTNPSCGLSKSGCF